MSHKDNFVTDIYKYYDYHNLNLANIPRWNRAISITYLQKNIFKIIWVAFGIFKWDSCRNSSQIAALYIFRFVSGHRYIYTMIESEVNTWLTRHQSTHKFIFYVYLNLAISHKIYTWNTLKSLKKLNLPRKRSSMIKEEQI